MVVYCLACVVINASYEGTLKSHLTVVREPKPMETLEEMAMETTGDIVWPASSANDFYIILEQSPINKMKTLAEDRNIVPWTKPYSEVHKEALHGNIVINSGFFERYEVKKQLSYQDGSTDMQIIPQWFTYYYYVFQMPKMSRFGGLINKRVFQLSESGHLTELLKRVLDKEESTPLDEAEETNTLKDEFGVALEPLNLSIYTLLCIAYAIGITIGLVSFVIEYKDTPLEMHREIGSKAATPTVYLSTDYQPPDNESKVINIYSV